MNRDARFGVATMAGRIAVGYALLASLAVALALALRKGVPWWLPEPWLTLSRSGALLLSGGLGLAVAALVVVGTRLAVHRFAWAQRLHLELRPIAHGLGRGQISLIAVLSSLGEELLFRGLLQPWLGVLPTSVLFGVAHQVPGQSRWVWVCWATFVGMAFAIIFAATGSLLGPVLAHAAINAINLAFLRDHDPLGHRAPPSRRSHRPAARAAAPPTETADPADRAGSESGTNR